MNFGLYLTAFLLVGIALLSGGCSVIFTPFIWQGFEPILWLIWASGFVVAIGAALLAIKLFRNAS